MQGLSKIRSMWMHLFDPVFRHIGVIVDVLDSHLCTEQLIYIRVISELSESTEISADRYTNFNGIVSKNQIVLCQIRSTHANYENVLL